MKAKHLVTGTGTGATVIQGDQVNVRLGTSRKPKMEYPIGSIGADLMRRNYIRYLTERYHRYRATDASFGPGAVRKFSYAVLFKSIEAKFKSPTYFIPVTKFNDLVDFLQAKINGTILGKRNHARGISNHETFDEFQLTQLGA